MSRTVRKQKVPVGQVRYYGVPIVAITESTMDKKDGGVAAFVDRLVC